MKKALAVDRADPDAAERVFATLSRIWRAARSITSDTIVGIRIGREAGVLNAMSDAQLSRIGLDRRDILRHAESVVLGDPGETGTT